MTVQLHKPQMTTVCIAVQLLCYFGLVVACWPLDNWHYSAALLFAVSMMLAERAYQKKKAEEKYVALLAQVIADRITKNGDPL